MRLALAKWALGPVLIAQGLRVRSRTPVLPEPHGPREGVAGAGTPLRLLVLGDSAGAGVGAATQDEALTGRILARLTGGFLVEWRLMAQTGETTESTILRVRHAGPFVADVVVISLGVNDVTHGVEASRFARLQGELHALLRERFGARLILATGLPPMGRFPALPQPLRWYLGARALELDGALAAMLPDGQGAEHLLVTGNLGANDMAPDGFHPGPAIYEAWAEAAARRIASIFTAG